MTLGGAHPVGVDRQPTPSKLVDENGAALPTNERGELRVRGTSVFHGYSNRPEINAGLFEDGWSRGCGQVEAGLLMHPDFHGAAVYAVPEERLSEEVAATVYGSQTPGVDAVREVLLAQLVRFEVPRFLRKSAGPLPRTASGKILKRQLRDEMLAAMATRDDAGASGT